MVLGCMQHNAAGSSQPPIDQVSLSTYCPRRGQSEARAEACQGASRGAAAAQGGPHRAAQAGAVRVSPPGPVPCPPHARSDSQRHSWRQGGAKFPLNLPCCSNSHSYIMMLILIVVCTWLHSADGLAGCVLAAQP